MTALVSKKKLLEEYKAGKITSDEIKSMLNIEMDVDVPLSRNQLGLWSLCKAFPENSAYLIPLCLRFNKGVNIDSLTKALFSVLDRHRILRSKLVKDQHNLLMRAQEPGIFDIKVEDCSTIDEKEIRERIKLFCLSPIDVNESTLIQAKYFYSGKQKGYIVIIIHHIIFDGTSAVQFCQEILENYIHLLTHKKLPQALAATQFSEFVRWQESYLQSERGQRACKYWQQVMNGAPSYLNLSREFRINKVQAFIGESYRCQCPTSIIERVERFTSDHSISKAVLFLGVFNGLLSRYTGEEDIVIGMPSLGRPSAKFQECIGYFINMIPIRSPNINQGSAESYFASLQYDVLDGLEHAAYPFPELVKFLNIDRSTIRNPVFNVAYAYQNFVAKSWTEKFEETFSKKYGIELIDDFRQEGEYELELEVVESQNALTFHFKYWKGVYSQSEIERFCQHYLNLLSSVLENPERSLADHDVILSEEKSILAALNNTKTSIPPGINFYQWIVEQAERTPNNIAYSYLSEQITYAELIEKVTALSSYLQAKGLGESDRVAICVERSLNLPVAILAIVAAGAAYVPLDPSYPDDRLKYMLEDSQSRFIITEKSVKQPWMEADTLINLDELTLDKKAADKANEFSPGRSGDVAYIIYTSGSTGNPKGVVVSHKNLKNFLFSMQRHFSVNETDRLLAVTTFSFDIAALELYLPAISGAECVICPTDYSRDPERLKSLLVTTNPSIMQATPTTWQLLFRVDWKPERHLKLLCGGEALPAKLRDNIVTATDKAWNLYGPTETTVWSTVSPIRAKGRVSIGSPIANSNIYILNRFHRIQPLNAPGELGITGDGVALGYYRNPQKTQESFIQNNHDRSSKTLYKTGDVAIIDDQGSVFCLAREDLQIKLRGYRIDVAEIEILLEKFDQVDAAIVVVKTNDVQKKLVAYLRLAKPVSEDDSGVRNHPDDKNLKDNFVKEIKSRLTKLLPDYMIPNHIYFIEDFPKTNNNKINRVALSERPLPELIESSCARDEYTTNMSQVIYIREIWNKVLSREIEDINLNFFEAGGDSVLAVTVAEDLSALLGRKVPVTDIFRYPTIQSLAGELEEVCSKNTSSEMNHEERIGLEKKREVEQAVTDVAVIGISCQFSNSGGLNEFWANLCNATPCVSRWSDQELNAMGVDRAFLSDERFVPVKAVLNEKLVFDHAFFGLSPRDADFMDLPFRHLLMHSWCAFEDAGYIPGEVPSTSVYISAGQSLNSVNRSVVIDDPDDYARWIMAQGGSIPTMISYKLGLVGPSVFMQSNCSSSLVALEAGVSSIRSGKSRCALVGASTIFNHQVAGYVHTPGLNFSSTGQCRAFDDNADGMVGGEGAAVLLLKRSDLAMRDNDSIYALIKDVQINNDGALKASFFSPSVKGQTEVIAATLSSCGISGSSVDYIETHGTGTKLGDPIEFTALKAAYGSYRKSDTRCGIGSVKSNIGHTDTVAGLAGAIKVMLSLKYAVIPPTINLDTPNKHIDISESGFYLVDKLTPWPRNDDERRFAAVSAFGIGGTNAHAIFQNGPDRAERHLALDLSEERAHVFPFSAKSFERLRQLVKEYTVFTSDIQRDDDSVLTTNGNSEPEAALGDVAFTLQVGRVSHRYRLAVIADSWVELEGSLRDFLYERQRSNVFVTDMQLEEQVTADFTPTYSLAQKWVSGETVDWSSLNSEDGWRRVHLPVYPFFQQASPGASQTSKENRPDDSLVNLSSPSAAEHSNTRPGASQEDSVVFNAIAKWQAFSPEELYAKLEFRKTLIIHHGSSGFPRYSNADLMNISDLDEHGIVQELLKQHAHVDHIIWHAPRANKNNFASRAALEDLTGSCDQTGLGVMLLKSIVNVFKDRSSFSITLVTEESIGVLPSDKQNPLASVFHGLVATIVREQSGWRARIIDVGDTISDDLSFIDDIALSNTPEAIALRNNIWYEQRLSKLELDHQHLHDTGAYRENGVYLIIGGAGEIGFHLSKYIVKNYNAQVIWVGRRSVDQEIRKRIELVSRFGRQPIYIQADATVSSALKLVEEKISCDYPVLNGIIHAVMSYKEQSFDRQDAVSLKNSVFSKVKSAINLEHIFFDHKLDFTLYISSISIFYKNKNASSYVAGCQFLSSYVDHVNKIPSCNAKIIHLGHWASESLLENVHGVRDVLSKQGYGLVFPGEAFGLFEILIKHQLNHVCAFRFTNESSKNALKFSEETYRLKKARVNLEDVRLSYRPAEMKAKEVASSLPVLTDLEIYVRAKLWQQTVDWVNKIGTDVYSLGQPITLETLLGFMDGSNYLRKWLESTVLFLQKNNDLNIIDGVIVTSKPFINTILGFKSGWGSLPSNLKDDPFMRKMLTLLDLAFSELPNILLGSKAATDIFYSSKAQPLIESSYKDSAVSRFFNSLISETVAASVAQIIADQPERKIRILEVGGGTGSATEPLLSSLKGYEKNIDEYCFTDLSPSFLRDARKMFSTERSYFSTKIFDIEKSPKDQNINADHYDIVVASNVVHATKNIRNTLLNIQYCMAPEAGLFLLEIEKNSLMSHTIFGLMEGWWNFSDSELRLPMGPALSPESWEHALNESGFYNFQRPQPEILDSGLQVIFAQSSKFGIEEGLPNKIPNQSLENTGIVEKKLNTVEEESSVTANIGNRKYGVGSSQEKIRSCFNTLAEMMGSLLQIDKNHFDAEEPLGNYGLDSIVGVKFVEKINDEYSTSLVAGVLYEHNTLNSLALHVTEQREGKDVEADQTLFIKENIYDTHQGEMRAQKTQGLNNIAQATQTSRRLATDDIALVGISCEFPKSKNASEFWDNIISGRDCIDEVPEDRWSWQEVNNGRGGSDLTLTAKWGGFIDGVYEFDPLFFGISPAEAILMDPQQRLLLKHAWLTIEDSGVPLREFKKKKTGVFVALGAPEYQHISDVPLDNPLVSSAMACSMAANRISYQLNLRGPSEYSDTGCSSSVVALHRAVQSIRQGECEQAVVGAVQLVLSPIGAISLGAMGFLSEKGRSCSFQEGADGFVRSEGVAAIVIKPITTAEKENTSIYAVIKGTGVSHGGAGVSLSSPNAVGMKDAISMALSASSIAPESIDYIETHGIASEIGDSVEFQALSSAFHQAKTCTLSSLKPIIGHAEIASGMAALIKTAFALKYKVKPGIPRFSGPSRHIPLDRSNLTISSENADWDQEDGMVIKPRRAAVNSFGFGGVNGFVVLEEYCSSTKRYENTEQPPQPTLFVISANDHEALRRNVDELRKFICESLDITLASLSLGLLRKSALRCRLALVANSKEDLLGKLKVFIDTETPSSFVSEGVWYGCGAAEVKNIITGVNRYLTEDITAQCWKARDYETLATLWCAGTEMAVDDLPEPIRNASARCPAYVFNNQIFKLQNKANREVSFTQSNTTPDTPSTQMSSSYIQEGGPPNERRQHASSLLSEILALDMLEIDKQLSPRHYGLDSLSAMMLQRNLKNRYGVNLSLEHILSCGSVNELDNLISQIKPENVDKPIAKNEERTKSEKSPVACPASVGQQGIWIEQKFSPTDTGNNIPYAFRLLQPLNEKRLQEAINEILQQHPALTSVFESKDNSLTLVTQPKITSLDVIKLESFDSIDNYQNILSHEIGIPFDLEKGPLFRVYIIRESNRLNTTSECIILFIFHHIIFDGSSLNTFLKDFFSLYFNRANSSSSRPDDNYQDFCLWQKSWLADTDGEKNRQFWLSQIPQGRKPVDFVDLSNKDFATQSNQVLLRLDITEEARARIEAYSAKIGVSRYSFCLTTFAVILRSFCDTDSLLLATPFSGRPSSQFDRVVGYFVNLLLISIDCQKNKSLVECLLETNRAVLAAIEHGNYPYKLINNERAPDGGPLYDAVFMFQNWAQQTQNHIEAVADRIEPISDIQQRPNFALAFEYVEAHENSFITAHFDASRYSEKKIRVALEKYVELLTSVSVDTTISECIALTTDTIDEKETCVTALSVADAKDSSEPYSNTTLDIMDRIVTSNRQSLSVEFEKRVELSPKSIALIYDDGHSTYRELNFRANTIARYLKDLHTYTDGNDIVVALMFQRDLDFVACALAVWKLGFAYLALDPSLPTTRLNFMLEDSGCAYTLTNDFANDQLSSQTSDLHGKLINLDKISDELSKQLTDNIRRKGVEKDGPPQDTCYVIYTSGSSGKPKGVRGSMRATLNRLSWGWKAFPYSVNDVCCQKTPLSFVDHVAELFSPLLAGVPILILADPWLKERGLSGFLYQLQRHRVTRLILVPSLLTALFREQNAAVALTALRYCFTSGEALSSHLAQTFYEYCPKAKLINIYGSSETSADATWKLIDRDQSEQITVGKPIKNVEVVVLDKDSRALDMMESGEIYVGGVAVAGGYIGDDVDNRFQELPHIAPGLFFKTGDLGFWNQDKDLVLIGRKDQQIKINGQRLDIGEVESILLKYDDIYEVMVKQLNYDGTEAGRLCGFIRCEKELIVKDLRQYMSEYLPHYMIPSYFYQLDVMPRLPSGKLDYRSLREDPDRLIPYERDQKIQKDANHVSDAFRNIIASIREISPRDVNFNQDFHQMGFDSFSLITLSNAVNEKFSLSRTPADFYRYETPNRWLDKFIDTEQEAAERNTSKLYKSVINSDVQIATREATKRDSVKIAEQDDDRIAVVGMSAIFPGSRNLEEFWDNLVNGRDLVSETPVDRWQWKDAQDQPGGFALRLGGFCPDIDHFSPEFFGLSPLEAEFMDPQHRLFLECAWHALENAGYAPRSLPEKSVGVFVGVSAMDYAGLLMSSSDVDPLANFGNGHSMLANRVSYLLDLTGPSQAIDTACSSSLVAVHEAVKAIRSGDCQWALAGGVSIMLEPKISQAMGRSNMLSPHGRCATFSAEADGYVRGEGVGVLVLKTLKQARKDDDLIYGVVLGSAVNHGGRGSSMTAPNPESQAKLIESLYHRIGILPERISYIETHGTGTPLGDPIEINALKEVWSNCQGSMTQKQTCALGAVKTNIGHLEAAAGVASVIKVLLSMQHKTLPQNLHCKTVNPYIDIDDSPFYLLNEQRPWLVNAGTKRTAGVSSFGIGGTNAHIVFEALDEEN